MKQSKWFVSHTQPENGLHWKNHQQFGIAIKYVATSELYNKGYICWRQFADICSHKSQRELGALAC